VINGANAPVTLTLSADAGPLVGLLGWRTGSTPTCPFVLRLDPLRTALG
jgi:hypothetical protein